MNFLAALAEKLLASLITGASAAMNRLATRRADNAAREHAQTASAIADNAKRSEELDAASKELTDRSGRD